MKDLENHVVEVAPHAGSISSTATELLPCPFCGGEAILTVHDDESRIVEFVVTRCKCGISKEHFDRVNAVEWWNTRANSSPNAKLVEALKDVADPLRLLKRHADAAGHKLIGAAYGLANDVNYVKSIAQDALSSVAVEERGGSK